MSFAAEKIRTWREHPDRFVEEVFGVRPDPWQVDALQAFPHHPRMALKACKGPGKTAFLGWIGWNFLLTRVNPKIAATSISGDNLRDNLWAEMSKWQHKSPILMEAFQWTTNRIFARERPESWFMSARTWSRSASAEDQGETLAGLHEDSILFILDEVGGIPQAVFETADAALATGGDAHLVMAGNPVRRDGPLYRACTVDKRLWWIGEITGDPDDPRRSPRISMEYARQLIQRYGREDPFVRINVLGQFPLRDLQSLLSLEDVKAAMERELTPQQLREAMASGRVLGVDVAREGDDRSVIFPRQGLLAAPPKVLRGADSIQGAGHVRTIGKAFEVDAVHVDNTGGFGSGWVDRLLELPPDPKTAIIPVHFGSSASSVRFYNKRTEMIWDCAEWIKAGGKLPNEPELIAELTAPTYGFKGDKIIMEPKESIKARIGRSPDLSDALALTFAFPVQRNPGWDAPELYSILERNRARAQDWDPLDGRHEAPYPGGSSRDWDPLG